MPNPIETVPDVLPARSTKMVAMPGVDHDDVAEANWIATAIAGAGRGKADESPGVNSEGVPW